MKIDIDIVSSINRKINSTMEIRELLLVIMDVAKKIVGVEGCSLLLKDKKTGELVFHIATGSRNKVLEGRKIPMGKGIAGKVAESGESLIVNDAQSDSRLFKNIDLTTNYVTRNLIAVPMIVQDELIGVLEVVNKLDNNDFRDDDFQKCLYIASQSAVAIDNRQMYDDLSSRVRELTSLYNVSQSISFSDNYDSILESIIIALCSSLDVTRGSILIEDGNSSELRIEASYGLPDSLSSGYVVDKSKSISGHVLRNGDPVIVSNIDNDLGGYNFEKNGKYLTDSFISVPIKHKGETIGVLNLSDKLKGGDFNSYDLRVLSTVASQISEVYLNNISKIERRDQKRLAQELEVAAGIQKKILKGLPSSFGPHHIAGYNKPAKAVGGDFYDFIKINDNSYALVIGDVSGKGIPAALFMGTVRTIMSIESKINRWPAPTLSNGNRLVCEESESGMFVTVFYAVIDIHSKSITFGSGGHNNQLLIRGDGSPVERLNSLGKPLGIDESAIFSENSMYYKAGDMLVLFTDGVVEFLSNDGMDIDEGEQKLIEIAQNHRGKGAQELVAHIKSNLKENYSEENADDFTILVVEF